ncbi:hypothetical protein COB52_04915, partial [Candidatus Kaiserbacteria bacterium]
MNSISVFLNVIFLTSLLIITNGCKLTEKVVNKGATDSSATVPDVPDTPDAVGGLNSLEILLPKPNAAGRIGLSTFLLSGTCRADKGLVSFAGDLVGPNLTAACLSDGTFSTLVTPTKLHAINTIEVRQNLDNGTAVDSLSFSLFPRDVFCGDGFVNQPFEVCDGGASCDEFCQTPDSFPTDLILAKVKVDSFENSGDGSFTPDIFLGKS